MQMNFAMSAMSAAELVLWAALAVLFLSKGLHRRFPAMGYYLLLRAISTPVLTLALYLASKPWSRDFHIGQIYYFGFFATYLASTVLLFFICIEVFRSALAAFPGIAKLAIVIFRWAAVVSMIVSLSSITYGHKGIYIVADVSYGLMHSVSVLELCLLAFLCLSMNALRLTVRDLSFGIALGFGVMSSADFILASWISRVASPSLIDPLQFVYEGLILGTLTIWVVYCFMPEPARRPVLMPASSTIYRWNEIASALGHTGTKVAVQQPANSFFLSDVERVVEKVLARNMKGRESET
jgi:hypothetical protein